MSIRRFVPNQFGDMMDLIPSQHAANEQGYVRGDDYQRLENAAMMVCIAIAKYNGGADAKTKLRDDIIDASDKILEAIGIDRTHWREHYDSLRNAG